MATALKPNILIVDDVADNLYLLKSILHKLDVNFILAQSGAEALLNIQGQEIALALIDVRMDGMDGIELATCIQNDISRGKIPVIFISGLAKDELELDECYQSGAVDFVRKPFRNNIILSKVKVFLELYQQKHQISEQKQHLEQVVRELQQSNKTLRQSDALLNNIIDNLPLTLFIKDAKNLSFVRINTAGEEMLGLTREALIGKTDYDFFPARQADFFARNDKEVIENSMLVDIPEEKIRTIHNGERILHTIKIPILNNEGVAEYLLGISEDITEKRQYENALRESDKMYRAMLNASPSGLVLIDIKGRITEVSDIILEIFGAENKDEFIGKYFFNIFQPSEENKIKDILMKTRKEGLVQNVEFIMIRNNQSRLICELSTTLIQEENGKPKAYMGIINDISQRKKIEQQLIRSERLVSLGEMASGMAHEINQPLLSITLGIENLFMKIHKANLVDETYFQDKSQKIFDDILRIGRIIDHVRVFSRDQDSHILTPFNVNESIENAISMISAQFKHYSISFDISLDDNLPLVIGDTYKFEQVMLNLLNNAKDALEDKLKISGPDFKKNLKIRTWNDAGINFVEVQDNGNGIKTDDIDRIMQPFYTTKDVGRGTGLGLSVSYGIIKEMNGNIEVESDSSSGTRFRITLPVAETE